MRRIGSGAADALFFLMPRLRRSVLVFEGSLNHCTWRSHDRSFVLDKAEEKRKFLALVAEYKARFGIRVLSYCIMGTHPHLVVRCAQGQTAFSAFWKVVNQRFARWYNLRRSRRGQVVMERLASPLIQDARHLLGTMRYGDLNPVRAGLVRSPKDYRWSSYRHYALGEPDGLIDEPAPEYLALGATPAQRRKAYARLFASRISALFRLRRVDLVVGPFVGDEDWIFARRMACGLSPPS
jgi:putative transposase